MQRRQQWRQQLVALQRPVHLRSYLCESYPHDDRLASVRRGSSEYLLLLLQDCNKAAFAKAPAAFFTCLGSQAMSEPAQSRNTTHLTSGLWHRIKVWFLVRCMRSCDSQAGRQRQVWRQIAALTQVNGVIRNRENLFAAAILSRGCTACYRIVTSFLFRSQRTCLIISREVWFGGNRPCIELALR